MGSLQGGSETERNSSYYGDECGKDERRLNVANNLFVERDYNGAYPRIVIRILLRKTRGDGLHLCLGLLQSDTGLQARDHLEEMVPTLGRFFGWKCNRHP